MRSAVKVFALVAASLVASACFNVSLLVTLRPDGRGTIDETVMMTAQAKQQFAGLVAMGGGDPKKAQVTPDDMFSEAEVRKRAAQMGEGVRLESIEPIRTAEGEGYKARYRFDDVTTIRLSQVPDTPVSGMTGGPSTAGTFGILFDRGTSSSLLTLKMPAPREDEPGTGKTVIPEDMPPEALMMARQMFKGARMSVVLALDGRITRTNAPAALVDGSRITLAEIDFEQLLSDPAALQRLRELRSIAQARTMAAGVPGLRMFTDPELVVQFSGR